MKKLLIKLLGLICASGNIFAASYGNFIYYDSVYGTKNITYEKVSGYAVTEGDIILKKLDNLLDKNNISPKL